MFSSPRPLHAPVLQTLAQTTQPLQLSRPHTPSALFLSPPQCRFSFLEEHCFCCHTFSPFRFSSRLTPRSLLRVLCSSASSVHTQIALTLALNSAKCNSGSKPSLYVGRNERAAHATHTALRPSTPEASHAQRTGTRHTGTQTHCMVTVHSRGPSCAAYGLVTRAHGHRHTATAHTHHAMANTGRAGSDSPRSTSAAFCSRACSPR